MTDPSTTPESETTAASQDTTAAAHASAPAVPAQSAAVPVASGLQMKRRNPLAAWLGLPLITLGIYHLVWYYKIHREMAEFDRRRAVPIAGPMLVLLFLGWTFIAPIISYNNAGKRVRDAQRSAGLVPTCSPALSWLLWFAFGLNTLYLQVELNKVIDKYGSTAAGMQVPLYV